LRNWTANLSRKIRFLMNPTSQEHFSLDWHLILSLILGSMETCTRRMKSWHLKSGDSARQREDGRVKPCPENRRVSLAFQRAFRTFHESQNEAFVPKDWSACPGSGESLFIEKTSTLHNQQAQLYFGWQNGRDLGATAKHRNLGFRGTIGLH
jgi:hypothetical protein